jgi:RNA polymerase sigma-70 factor (ECF subfamily)
MSISELDTASFSIVRPRLFGIAYRVLGSASEADDVVQDAWIRWQGTDRSKVRDAAAFLAATTMRLAINVGQSARARRETSLGSAAVEPVDRRADPSLSAEQREELERALHTVLEHLSPAERAVYLLHEAFDYPYREIAESLATTEVNARQLGMRARRRLRVARRGPVRCAERRGLFDAFMAAAERGEVAALERLLVAEIAGSPEAIRVAA